MNAQSDVNMHRQKSLTAYLGKNDVVLFQGDSITDAGCNLQAEDQANHGAALGKAMLQSSPVVF